MSAPHSLLISISPFLEYMMAFVCEHEMEYYSLGLETRKCQKIRQEDPIFHKGHHSLHFQPVRSSRRRPRQLVDIYPNISRVIGNRYTWWREATTTTSPIELCGCRLLDARVKVFFGLINLLSHDMWGDHKNTNWKLLLAWPIQKHS